MIKFFKKAVSAFLASVMCIPAGIVNIAAAEENDTGTVTTVKWLDAVLRRVHEIIHGKAGWIPYGPCR